MQGLGAIESDIYMLSDKINTICKEHPEMSIDEIKKIPQILENPILILSSKGKGKDRNNSRIVVFGSVKASNGLPVLTILDMRPIENNLMTDDMQKVTSAYTKTKSPADFVKTSDVLYLDKKRTVKLLRSIGLQYRPTDLLLNGYIGSIDYSGTDVNISGVPFSPVVKETEEQNQQRTSTLTDREALQYAASEIPSGRRRQYATCWTTPSSTPQPVER